MNPHLLRPEVQQFIRQHTPDDVTALALQRNPFPELSWQEILGQIAARQKAKEKLPAWYAKENIIYPSKVSVEQTSSAVAAQYKAGLVSGESLIDMTGGFGIDDYYFAKRMKEVFHCEMNLELSAIAAHNFDVLGADNIHCAPGDSTDTLRLLGRQWDWIYIDPSRRSDVKGKVFLLKDCLPDVPARKDFYFRYTRNILVKTAPLLDISAGLAELQFVKAIHIVAVQNEVKELLWVLEKDFSGIPVIEALNITRNGTQAFAAPIEDEPNAPLSQPQKYLYEPNSAVMKSGAFNKVAAHFGVNKLQRNSHLYTSDSLIDFPGRRFEVHETFEYSKAAMKELEGKKLNITARNFPLSTDALRKKWKIKDGGERYAFFTTNVQNEKIVLLCAKI